MNTLANRTYNYNRDKIEFHDCFNQFCTRNVDDHHATPFFFYLHDHGIKDINESVLSNAFRSFQNERTDIIYYD